MSGDVSATEEGSVWRTEHDCLPSSHPRGAQPSLNLHILTKNQFPIKGDGSCKKYKGEKGREGRREGEREGGKVSKHN